MVDYVKSTKVFRRNKKDVELKILAALLYFFGLSLRKNKLFEETSRISQNILPQTQSLKTKKEEKVNSNR